MAPSHSRLSAGTSRGPKDAVFLAATRFVRPSVDGALVVLRELLDDLRNRASTSSARTAHQVAEVFGGCEAAVRSFFRSRRQPLSGPLPIAFVLWILGLLYCAFVFAYLPAAGLGLHSPASVAFHALYFLILASFARAAAMDPGGVPDSPEWRTPGEPPAGLREQKRGTGEARWCRREECYKPDRAHRSSALGRTVLRMDHHCIWLGNTVGFRNHKFFLLFLFYANAACSYFGWSILELLVHSTLPALSSFLLMGASGLATVLLTVLCPFFAFHCWLLFRNTTTVEFMEGHRRQAPADDAAEGTQEVGGSPYDLGWFHNLRSVLGESPLTWLLPLGGPSGNGLRFPRVDDERLRGAQVVTCSLDGLPIGKEGGSGFWVALSSAAIYPVLKDGAFVKTTDTRGDDLAAGGEFEGLGSTLATPAGQAGLDAPADENDEIAEASAASPGSSAWDSASAFVEDLSLGLHTLGALLVQTAADTSGHLCSLGILGAAEQKARHSSWQRIARRSAAAVAPSVKEEGHAALLSRKVKDEDSALSGREG